jgi:hypothetical protein
MGNKLLRGFCSVTGNGQRVQKNRAWEAEMGVIREERNIPNGPGTPGRILVMTNGHRKWCPRPFFFWQKKKKKHLRACTLSHSISPFL